MSGDRLYSYQQNRNVVNWGGTWIPSKKIRNTRIDGIVVSITAVGMVRNCASSGSSIFKVLSISLRTVGFTSHAMFTVFIIASSIVIPTRSSETWARDSLSE